VIGKDFSESVEREKEEGWSQNDGGNIVRIIVVRIIGERRWQNNLGQNNVGVGGRAYCG
jgi:hypothetical protein